MGATNIVLMYLLSCISTSCTCCALFGYMGAQYLAMELIQDKDPGQGSCA